MQSKQVNPCFVFTLIRVRVRDFLSRTSVSELVATCSDFLRHRRQSSSEVVQCACSKPPVHVVATVGYQKWPLPRVTSDPSLGYSVNTILSGARTLTRTRILGQCKCKCPFTLEGGLIISRVQLPIVVISHMAKVSNQMWTIISLVQIQSW